MEQVFSYKAVEGSGKIIESVIEAKSEIDAVNLIRSQHMNVISIVKKESTSKNIMELQLFAPKPKSKDLMIICKQLATMLSSGVPMDKSLMILHDQAEKKHIRTALSDISTLIRQGISFSRGLRNHPEVFPELIVNMVEAGELTGKLDEVLERMAIHYEKENKISAKVQGAMVYPIVLSCLVVAVVIIMLTFVMPTFMEMFESADVEMPLLTRMLISLSDSMISFWYIYIGVIASIVYSAKKYFESDNGKRVKNSMQLRIPVVKGAIKQIVTSRFTRTLSTLLSSGVPIIKALESAAQTTNNYLIIDEMKSIIDGIKRGGTMSMLLRKIPVFPPMMISMIHVGEESGDIDGLLEKTADFYDQELEGAMAKLIALMEPALIIIMAAVVGTIVIAMFLPMFEMYNAVQ